MKISAPIEFEPLRRKKPLDLPLKVLQFGEGNFLRAFFDWMIHGLNARSLFNGSVRLVQPLPHGSGDFINAQGGLYTTLLRGLRQGKPVREISLIGCVSGCVNPYTDWPEVVRNACCDTLEFVVSNTTEAGIAYRSEDRSEAACPTTFPAKIAELLYRRYERFRGDPEKGLIFLPCELIERNGDTLRNIVIQYAEDWNLGDGFLSWLIGSCRFLNTLVDRIVSGFPRDEYDKLRAELGYEDRLLTTGELFHYFVIESDPSLEEKLPLIHGGFNVVLTRDLEPYHERKVRFLNGAHTATALAGHLCGFEYVDELVRDPMFSNYLRRLLFDEIDPTVRLDDAEKTMYAEAVLERFANPFLRHRLLTIALNSVSKWKVRVLPSLKRYFEIKATPPRLLVFSLAALIAFYRNTGGITVSGHKIEDEPAVVRFFEDVWQRFGDDEQGLVDAVLEHAEFRDTGLRDLHGLPEMLAPQLRQIETLGMRGAVETQLDTQDH